MRLQSTGGSDGGAAHPGAAQCTPRGRNQGRPSCKPLPVLLVHYHPLSPERTSAAAKLSNAPLLPSTSHCCCTKGHDCDPSEVHSHPSRTKLCVSLQRITFVILTCISKEEKDSTFYSHTSDLEFQLWYFRQDQM